MDDKTGWDIALEILPTLSMLLVVLFYWSCVGRILAKAGRPFWTGFVPYLNVIKVLEIVGRPAWWILLFMTIPVIVAPFVAVDLAKSFGKSTWYGVVLVFFLFFIGLPMLAFGKARYVGPSVYRLPPKSHYRQY